MSAVLCTVLYLEGDFFFCPDYSRVNNLLELMNFRLQNVFIEEDDFFFCLDAKETKNQA